MSNEHWEVGGKGAMGVGGCKGGNEVVEWVGGCGGEVRWKEVNQRWWGGGANLRETRGAGIICTLVWMRMGAGEGGRELREGVVCVQLCG